MIYYEHPLNERVRTLLRLEDLFDKIAFFSVKDTAIDHHAALISLFEVLDITNRADVKSELLQELERQKQVLETLRNHPNISEQVLEQVLQSIHTTFHEMLKIPGKVGEHLRENEWLMSIKQRVGLPGGVNKFDLPSYHYWLHLDPELRYKDFDDWLTPFLPIRDSFSILLHLLRSSGKTFNFVAEQGIFQQASTGHAAHLLRIKTNDEMPCIPEVSANQSAINIRFFPPEPRQKTRVVENNIPFELTLCYL